MAELGDLLGSLMCGLIKARRMADEQTAALAEYYKNNPLLEGLSVPRIRIPELTVDLPLLIENHLQGENGKLETPAKIATAAAAHLKETLAKYNIKLNAEFQKVFFSEFQRQLELIQQSNAPIMKETIARTVQNTFSNTLLQTKSAISETDKQNIAKELRASVFAISFSKEPVSASIIANIKTADVKEKASSLNVVRLKITLKEEGLEWATQSSESGGVIRTLQPE
jgi:hypothetical protein